ncbi:MAG: histidine phosphatase family protein [Syntrophobacteraceae bacterium]|nr:histidine phosphatase family protein [Syntrophobacteraceae bacterium]
MCIILLIRHGSNPAVGKRATGRMPGIHLDEQGKVEAEGLVERLSAMNVEAIVSSPMERTVETAQPLAVSLGLEIEKREEFSEIEIGDWSGREFEELLEDPLWQRYNVFRTGTRPPGGELMVEVQQRMVTGIEKIRGKYPAGVVAIFSHADPIKAALAHYTGIPLDFVTRLEISLVSVSIISIDNFGPRLLCMNSKGELPRFLPVL